MGIFFLYILKSSICLILFYLFFRLLLSKETFHRFNRIALLGVLFLSLIIPWIEVTTTYQVEVQQTALTIEQLIVMAEAASPSEGVAVEVDAEAAPISWVQIVLLVYLAGIVGFICRNLYALSGLLRLIHSGKREKMAEGITLVIHEQEVAPFSWMKYIVISRKDLEENGREILIHETAHVRNCHSIDLLIADICISLQWFNPGAWLLKRELQNIHEYEADNTVINEGVNAKEYQLLLIKKAVGTRLYSMANSFNHSKLKKRITMMLKEKSSPWARLKYVYVLPLAAIAVTAFARPEISRNTEEISAVKVNDLTAVVETKVEKMSSDTLEQLPKTVYSVSTKTGVSSISTPKKNVSYNADSVKIDKESVVAYGISQLGMNNLDESKRPLIIINGKESDYSLLEALNPNFIESVAITDRRKAIKTYGDRGKNGVITIQLYTADQLTQKNKKGINPQAKLDALNSGSKNWGVAFRSSNGAKPLVLIDGQEAFGEDPFSQIAPDRIRSISVLKDKTSIATYGERGKNGVIEVNLMTEEEYQHRKQHPRKSDSNALETKEQELEGTSEKE